MAKITYTYEITSVDTPYKTMMVVYSSQGRPSITMGVPIPTADNSLDAIIEAYAPLTHWLELDKPLLSVTTGTSGTKESPPLYLSAADMPSDQQLDPLVEAKILQKINIAKERYIYEISGTLINGERIDTRRDTQAALTAAYVSLKNGLLTKVDWKESGGKFVSLELPTVEGLAYTVSNHVQNAFTIEKDLNALIDAATTVEEVRLIKWPE